MLEVEYLEVAFSVLRCHCGTGILHHQYYYCGKLQNDLLNLVDLLVLLEGSILIIISNLFLMNEVTPIFYLLDAETN